MIEIKHLLRRKYIDKLATLTYLNQPIPVNSDYLQVAPAILPLGNSSHIQAYVIVQNQTVNDDSLKCGINQNTSLQLDIVTVFNANSGSSLQSEEISQEIMDLLFPLGGKVLDISIAGFVIWRGWLESSRSITQETADNRIFRNILIFNHSITQGTSTT